MEDPDWEKGLLYTIKVKSLFVVQVYISLSACLPKQLNLSVVHAAVSEIELCTVYLKSDERNFHCWDYRRFVVKHFTSLENNAEKELEFSFDKIKNISNYSAWHYRSKLLPIVHPSSISSIGVDESERREELQLVENAVYTDPADSSAWFYFRWLLSSCSTSNTSSNPKLQIIKVSYRSSIII